MSRVTDQSPMEDFTIQGFTFSVPQPYVAGTLDLTAGEASALNQTFAENIRNNFASTIQQAEADYRKANGLPEGAEVAKDQIDKTELDKKLAEYVKVYEFGVRTSRGIRTPTDPVEREAYRIAGDILKNALKQKGIKLDSVSKEWMATNTKTLVETKPEIMAEAKRRTESAASFALSAIATPEPVPAAAPEPAAPQESNLQPNPAPDQPVPQPTPADPAQPTA